MQVSLLIVAAYKAALQATGLAYAIGAAKTCRQAIRPHVANTMQSTQKAI